MSNYFIFYYYYYLLLWILYFIMTDYQGPDLYAFIGFIRPDDDDIN